MISPEGYIVTNNHVVADANEIHVVFSDKQISPARLVGRDPATDIAVLKVDPRPNMTTTAWGDLMQYSPAPDDRDRQSVRAWWDRYRRRAFSPFARHSGWTL